MKLLVVTAGLAFSLAAEVHTLTLKQVSERALTQSPDAILSRLDEQRAQRDIEVARDPYTPKFIVGSGLGKSFGFPMIGGAAPSVFEARGSASIYNRKQQLELKQAREEVDLSALAREYLNPARASEFIVLPVKPKPVGP